MEGYFSSDPKARPRVNNNPGDLRWCPEAEHFGATHGDRPGLYQGFAVFPDIATGWEALKRWLSVPAVFDKHGNLVGGYLGATYSQVINRFAPASDGNNPEEYINFVCSSSGHLANDILTETDLELPML